MAHINASMFRQYDIRGQVNESELNETSIELIGRAFGTYIRRHSGTECIVGHDARSYSPNLAHAYARGLNSAGVNVLFIGQVLTPITQASQYYLKCLYSGMITASHNPNGWSGLKQGIGYSLTISGADIQALRTLIEEEDFEAGTGTLTVKNVLEEYGKDVVSRVQIVKPLTVVLNARHGSAGSIVPTILRRAGANVIEMFCNVDTTFPHGNPNPSDDAMMEELGEMVRGEHADLGFAIDGDGDRLGIVDERGRNIYPDRVLALLARQALGKKPGSAIVFDVKCSQSLIDDIQTHGGTPVFSKTGYLFVKQTAKEHKAPLGGERSGHLFFFDDYYGIDDACFNGLKFLDYLSHQEESLSTLVDSLPVYFSSPVYNAYCADDKKFEVIKRIQTDFKAEFDTVIDMDGARVVFPDGFALIRPSSNMPAMVMIFEGKTKERLNEIVALFKKKLTAYPEIAGEWSMG